MLFLNKIKQLFIFAFTLVLSACSLVVYKPVETIKQVNVERGYRQKNVIAESAKDGNIVVIMFQVVEQERRRLVMECWKSLKR